MYFQALQTETKLLAERFAEIDDEVITIFVGGGTPSLINLDYFYKWLELLKKSFKVTSDIEFSIENNPDSITFEILKTFKDMGVNRPIFGIQSFNTELLKILHRKHNPHYSQRAIYYANILGFRNYGVDIIFGLPHQTVRTLSDDIEQIIDLKPPHISFYQLTVEENTTLGALVNSGQLQLPDQELMLEMYRRGSETFKEAGYFRYEVSSFAQPGFECQHNLGYWEGRNYLGLGPSAHSFMNDRRWYNKPNLDEYIALLKNNELPQIVDQSGKDERITEAIMLGLRTSRGIDRSQFSRRFGMSVEKQLNIKQLELFVESGYILQDKGSLRLSEKGTYIADEITRRLLK